MTRILVTGGTGYLGGRIVSYLRGQGYQVCIGTRRSFFVDRDDIVLTDYEDKKRLIDSLRGFESIIHLSGSNEIESAKDPDRAMYETAVYTRRISEAARSAGIARFIYFSTVHVYGTPLCGTLRETVCPRPLHPYAIVHRSAEDFILADENKGYMKSVIVRLTNGFGHPIERDINRWTLVVNDLCRQAIEKNQLVLNSSGRQYRDFIPMTDICLAVQTLLEADLDAFPVYNLGSGKSVSVYSMAVLIANIYMKLYGIEIPIFRTKNDLTRSPVEFLVDIGKILKIGYRPRNETEYEISHLLEMCTEWF